MEDPVSPADSYSALLHRAIEVGVRAHAGQRRKVAAVPYVIHPLRVACLVLAHGQKEYPIAIAAVLHDTVEHGRLTIDFIRGEFGDEVARLVAAVTHESGAATWVEKKSEAIAALKDAPDDVITLACADKLDNLLSLKEDMSRYGSVVWERMKRSRADQAWYFWTLHQVFRARLPHSGAPSLLIEYCTQCRTLFGD